MQVDSAACLSGPGTTMISYYELLIGFNSSFRVHEAVSINKCLFVSCGVHQRGTYRSTMVESCLSESHYLLNNCLLCLYGRHIQSLAIT